MQNKELAAVQQQWEGWSLEVEQLVRRAALQGSDSSKELGDIKLVTPIPKQVLAIVPCTSAVKLASAETAMLTSEH